MESEEEEKYCTNCKRSVAANNFAIHSAYCERNIFVCKICKEPVGISEKDEHFENYHVITPCNLCEASIEKWMLPDHMEICPKRLLVCKFCEAEFPFDEYTEHLEFCGSRTEKCLLCKKYIMMKDKAKHTELHVCEQKYNKKKIEEEIKQNKVNEVISCLDSGAIKKIKSEDCLEREETRKGDPKTRIGANFEGMKDSALNKTSCDIKKIEQDHGIHSLQGATASPSRAKEKSSRYVECHICKQSIPWIDMNTHIPSCASLAGKCSLCGEDVPNHAMKDHMRGHFTGSFQMQSVRGPDSRVSYMEKHSSDHDQTNAAKLTPHFDKHTDGMKSSSVNEYQCPLCLEMVPRKDKRRHERDCQMVQDNTELDSTYFSRSVSQSFYECPLCSEKVSEENRQSHSTFDCKMLLENNRPSDTYFSRSVSESFYECPLCSEKVSEENRQAHLTLDCKMLLENSRPSDTSSTRSDSSDIYECPLCMAFMPLKDKKKHELFECEVLIVNSGVHIPEPESYADIAKKTCQCHCRKKNNSCGKCKNIPQHKTSDYQKPCQPRKVACQYCEKMVDVNNIDVHENYCPAKAHKSHSKHGAKNSHNTKTLDNKQKGAVPKQKRISEMLKPETGQCKYCYTTLNMDILKYHESECVHKPVDCPECSRNIPLKDINSHECKKKKKKDMKHREDQQVPEEKNESGFGFKSFMNMFKSSSNKGKDEKENTNRQYSWSSITNRHDSWSSITNRHDSWSSIPYRYSDYQQVPDTEGSQPLYFQDALVPCEFCNTKVLASELVLHETGCQPDLLSYAKQEPSGNANPDKSSTACDSVLSNTKEMKESVIRFNKTNMGCMEQPFFPGNSILTSDRRKEGRKSDAKPGEFLQVRYEKSSSRILRSSEGIGNKSEGKNEECNSFQSVWNSGSYRTEDLSDQMSTHLEDAMDVDKFNECTINERTIKHGSEIVRQASEEMLSEDGDMNAYLCFLNDDRNNKLDKENKIESEVEEKRAKYKSPEFASYSVLDSNLLKEHVPQKNYKDCSDKRNTNTEGESSRLFNKNIRSVAHFHNNGVEIKAAIQQLKDLRSDPTAAIPYKRIPIETNTLEKKDEKPELSSKEKILLDRSKKSNKGSVDDFKKYLPDLKFDSSNKKFSSSDEENDELCAKDDGRCEKLLEKDSNKTYVYDGLPSRGECADRLKNQTDFKFGMHHSLSSCYEKNECKNMEDEKLIKQSYKSISSHDNHSEDSGDYISDFKNCVSELKFITHEKSNIIQKYNRLPSENNEEKHGEAQVNHNTDITKHIWTAKDDRKLAINSYNLTDSEIAHLKSERCSVRNSEHETFLQKYIVDEPVMPCLEKSTRNTASENECISNYKKYFPDFKFASSENSKEDSIHHTVQLKKNLIDSSEMEYSDDFKKYLPDFKFGSQITRSCKDKTCFANLADKKGQSEERSFQLQSAQHNSNESEGVQEDSMKKIKDLETRMSNTKQARQTVETENRTKWSQWRENRHFSSSDSE